ncbi:MAG: ATP-binding cassette domain-containing protein [Lachnospiraceae bacterium]|nr:ATP-binding cassette domain-containing protein [Lachnospiraceae bacterium]
MINIKDIDKSFDEKILFDKYSLDIPDKSFVIINGASGCGKTTLLNMIGGLEKPDAGIIEVNGIDIINVRNKRLYYKETVGFLFQNFALLENKTVRQNLEMIKKSDRTEITIEEALKKVGLNKEIDKKVYKLSGGEQQRVALARLMVKKCSLILADEPTGSLDDKNTKIVMDILHELNDMGKTIIIVTHNNDIVAKEKFVVKL